MLDYCDLNWEENCLNSSNNKTPTKTASIKLEIPFTQPL